MCRASARVAGSADGRLANSQRSYRSALLCLSFFSLAILAAPCNAGPFDRNATRTGPGPLNDGNYRTLSSACAAAGSDHTLVITRAWDNVPPSPACAQVWAQFEKPGRIQPANSVSIAFRMTSAGLYQVFDESLGGRVTPGTVAAFYPQWWGASGDGTTDDLSALQRTMDAAWRTARITGGLFNDGPDLGGVAMELSGREYGLSGGLVFPSGGGNIEIRSGALKALPNFPVKGYLVSYAGSSWISRVVFLNVKFDAAHRGGGVSLSHFSGLTFERCLFHGFRSSGLQTFGPSNELAIIDSTFYEFWYGEPGDPGAPGYQGRAMDINGSDTEVFLTVVSRTKQGIYANGASIFIHHSHTYSLADWAVYVPAATTAIRIEQNHFDSGGSGVVLENPYEITLNNNKWDPSAEQPWLVRIFPQFANLSFANSQFKNNRFVGSSYVPSGSLSLSNALYGSRNITASQPYFRNEMLGSVIYQAGGGGGFAVVTGYISAREATVQVQKDFTTTELAAGSWNHYTNSIWVDESKGAVTTVQNSVVAENGFYLAQPRWTNPVVTRTVTLSGGGVVQLGHVSLFQRALRDGRLSAIGEGAGAPGGVGIQAIDRGTSSIAWTSSQSLTGTVTIEGVTSLSPETGGTEPFTPEKIIGTAGTVSTVLFSPAPVFDLSRRHQVITLSEDVTVSRLINVPQGELITFHICQDGRGSHDFSWPANVFGAMKIGREARRCNTQAFISYDGASLYAISAGSQDQ